MEKKRYIIGIDEVGRGALAGPVVVAAVAIPKKINTHSSKRARLKDSKKLTPRAREAWCSYAKDHPKIFYTIARVYPNVIDRVNISEAANLAATRALQKLANSQLGLATRASVFLDGGLYVHSNLKLKTHSLQTLVRGDEKINAIKLASIVAKVTRDRYMIRLHKKYPQYFFYKHKGYGTKKHKRAIKKHGSCRAHRLTFAME